MNRRERRHHPYGRGNGQPNEGIPEQQIGVKSHNLQIQVEPKDTPSQPSATSTSDLALEFRETDVSNLSESTGGRSYGNRSSRDDSDSPKSTNTMLCANNDSVVPS